jgi:hypothetical protein
LPTRPRSEDSLPVDLIRRPGSDRGSAYIIRTQIRPRGKRATLDRKISRRSGWHEINRARTWIFGENRALLDLGVGDRGRDSSRGRQKVRTGWSLPEFSPLRLLPVVDARAEGLLWTALRWAAAALHQAERARADFELYRESQMSWIGVGTVRMTPEMERPASIFWSDVHFFMIAVKHLEKVLGMLGPSAPRLDRTLRALRT